jgi:sucrose phosphorylase
MFLTYGTVYGDGAREADLLELYRPRPGLPFTKYELKHRKQRLLWTTFTGAQIDIDVHHAEGKRYLESILNQFHAAGIHAIRLDAVGYAIKKAGTSCFMIPETFEFIAQLTAQAHALGIEVLVEIHSHYLEQIEIAKQVDWVYDFALPPLVLHTLYSRNARHLKRWFEIRPRNAVTVLDTHDGIGVLDAGADRKGGNLPGLLTPGEIDALVETIHQRSHNESRQATGAAANNLDLYQINCTFYDALGRSDDEYLIARALQLFTPGIPQVYYVGLLAGANNMSLLRRTSVGRDINRHYYGSDEIHGELRRPVVRALLDLIRFRNTHGAFAGEFHVLPSNDHEISLEWRNESERARLDVDLKRMKAVITYSADGRQDRFEVAS